MMPHIPTSTDPTGKLIYAQPSSNDSQQFLGKVDYNAGSHQINASIFRIHYTDPGWNGDGTLLNYKIGQDQTTYSFKAGDTWGITPTMVNSLNFSGLILNSVQTRTAPFSIFDFGNINATKPAAQFQETGVTVTSFSGWGSGGTQPPGTWVRDNFELSDVLTWIRGSHSVHFGGAFVPWSRFDSSTGYQEEPIMTFTGASTGNGLADLLTGRVATFVADRGQSQIHPRQAGQRVHPGSVARYQPPHAKSRAALGAFPALVRSCRRTSRRLHSRCSVYAIPQSSRGHVIRRRSRFSLRRHL